MTLSDAVDFASSAIGKGFSAAETSAGFNVSSDGPKDSSKGEPFSTEPRSCSLLFKAVPPVTALSSFGSEGNMLLGSSSAPATGLSGLAGGRSIITGPVSVSGSFGCSFWFQSAGTFSFPFVLVPSSEAEGVVYPFVFAVPKRGPPNPELPSFMLSPPPLPSPVLILFSPKPGPCCPLLSTEIKLVRTLEIGRELSLVTLSAGDRPREGGEVSVLFCSNIARRP